MQELWEESVWCLIKLSVVFSLVPCITWTSKKLVGGVLGRVSVLPNKALRQSLSPSCCCKFSNRTSRPIWKIIPLMSPTSKQASSFLNPTHIATLRHRNATRVKGYSHWNSGEKGFTNVSFGCIADRKQYHGFSVHADHLWFGSCIRTHISR